MILSGNSLEHALIMIAAMQAQIPVAPVSPAYALLSKDFAKLKHIFSLVDPGYVFMQDGTHFDSALKNLPIDDRFLIHVDRPPTDRESLDYADLASHPATDAVESSIASIPPDLPSRILFTSGSTGWPKPVPHTHRMLCTNFTATSQVAPKRLSDAQPTILSWLPWHHTMGSSAQLLRMLFEGGALYLDDGRPTPELFNETLRNHKEIPVTVYTSVPSGYASLVAALENDDELARTFFSRLETMGYGGASLSNDVYARLQTLAVKYAGGPVFLMTSWGATELGPNATTVWWPTKRPSIIGLPLAGMEIKLVPHDDKYEMRVRGPGVMSGYWRQPDLSAEAFDDEGFYITGDTGRFADPTDPTEGLEFAGRIAEDFKLSTGTFVHAGVLRLSVLAAAAPVLQDAIVTGHDRDFVGILAWLNVEACRVFAQQPNATSQDLARNETIITHIVRSLSAHGNEAKGSSSRIARVLIMLEPPSLDANELTDKGYINQRATREHRADLVGRLHALIPDADVIVIPH
jgi:feruloyl-CoA synthase